MNILMRKDCLRRVNVLTNNEIRKQMELGNIEITSLKEGALEKPNSCIISLTNTDFCQDIVPEIVNAKRI